MEGIGAEVSQKIRSAIKAKLMEIGVYVDEELPDYVMVMVANKRTKDQMDEELQLFLGKHTLLFTTWLHQVLQKLQEVTVANLGGIKRKLSEDSKKKKKSKLDVDKKVTKKTIKIEIDDDNDLDDDDDKKSSTSKSKESSRDKKDNSIVEDSNSMVSGQHGELIENKNKDKNSIEQVKCIKSISRVSKQSEESSTSTHSTKKIEEEVGETKSKSCSTSSQVEDIDDEDCINIRTDGELLDTAEEINTEEPTRKQRDKSSSTSSRKGKDVEPEWALCRSPVTQKQRKETKSDDKGDDTEKSIHRESSKKQSPHQSPLRSNDKVVDARELLNRKKAAKESNDTAQGGRDKSVSPPRKRRDDNRETNSRSFHEDRDLNRRTTRENERETSSRKVSRDDDKNKRNVRDRDLYSSKRRGEDRLSRHERKQSAKDRIKQHLKMPGIKKRLGGIKNVGEVDGEVSKRSVKVFERSPVKSDKNGSKALLKSGSSDSRKRALILNKRKVVKREGALKQTSVKQKELNLLDQSSKQTTTLEPTDLKQKLALLDERDKLIRKETVRDSNIKTAAVIKGTCPDMCPERERILRQCGHAVALYEMLPGSYEMDENKAVKEYIRSSADQEVPLPHDLRPEPVLSMTMAYLITNIINRADNPDENKAVWYSFCWNRLRSVRKDIILQQLCDMETVTIVEQCARFHISCYDHMWGAEVSGFDDKINFQILMDCLQTLRHMYEDLAKHGVTCPNEPEFYSYLILLKLESGDVMWEYQQYSLGIQLSSQVQFAIKVYMAFENNMFSRYFSLVKRASYLTACLMQRYFDKVRTQAVKTMLKAYCLPGKTVGLTSSFIVSCLKFDSHRNAMKFCEREEIDLKLDFYENEPDVSGTPSSFLIREKRLPIANAVVGEGNSLPVFVQHQVYTSFDESGRLKDSLPGVIYEQHTPCLAEESQHFTSKILAVNDSESNLQKPSFKFSVSPTKVTENIFGQSLLSTQVKQDDELNDYDCFTNTSPVVSPNTMFSFSSNNTTSNSYGMEEDMDQYVTFEDDEDMVEDETENVKPLFTSSMCPTTVQPGFPQHISVPTASSNSFSFKVQDIKSPNLVQNSSYPIKQVHDSQANKSQDGILSQFSFNIPKINSSALYSNDYGYNSTSANEMFKSHLMKENTTTFKFETFKEDPMHHKIEVGSLETTMKEEISADKPTQMPIYKDEKQMSEQVKPHPTAEDIEKANNALLLKQLLQKKAEEEKLKMEESKRIEMEKLRKRIEEQKILQMLKKDVSERLKAINARKYLRQWKEKIEKLKQTRADFPMLVQLSVVNHVSEWGTFKCVPANRIFQRARDKRNCCKIASHLLNNGITESCKYIGSDLAESLAKSAVKTMKKGSVKPVYWKVAVSVPFSNRQSPELKVFNQLMQRWCKQAFYKKADAQLGSVDSVITSLNIPTNISVHFSDDLQSSDLNGSDAMIFIVLSESESEKTCLQRLRTLVTSHSKSEEFSVAIMNVGGTRLERVLKMELEELHEQNFIAHWSVNSWSSLNSIMESLTFLTEHVNVVPHICATPLEVLVSQVSDEFFDTLNSSQHSHMGLANALKNPNRVINLYNTCLTKLEDLLMSSKLEKYFNFAEEFKMYVPLNESFGPEVMCGRKYDNTYKSQVLRKINSLKLPELSGWQAKSHNRLIKVIKSYCSQVHDISVFPQIIRMLDITDESNLLKHLEQVSWLNIVEIWAQCSIRHSFSSNEKSKRMFVIFNKNDVQRIITKQWWLKLP